jgi:cytochrome c-type biogenesis protein CcmH
MMLRFLTLALFLVTAPALAATDIMDNPQDEARAHALGEHLRCVVCQSETINDSQADMARDMRLLVRDKIREGWSDTQIIDYARGRYGDYILMKPPFQANTYALWGLPFVLSVGVFVLVYRRVFAKKRGFSRRDKAV